MRVQKYKGEEKEYVFVIYIYIYIYIERERERERERMDGERICASDNSNERKDKVTVKGCVCAYA